MPALPACDALTLKHALILHNTKGSKHHCLLLTAYCLLANGH